MQPTVTQNLTTPVSAIFEMLKGVYITKVGHMTSTTSFLETICHHQTGTWYSYSPILKSLPSTIIEIRNRNWRFSKEVDHFVSKCLPRNAMLARYKLSSCVCLCVCLFVCLSVTSRYCIKTATESITPTTPRDSSKTLIVCR